MNRCGISGMFSLWRIKNLLIMLGVLLVLKLFASQTQTRPEYDPELDKPIEWLKMSNDYIDIKKGIDDDHNSFEKKEVEDIPNLSEHKIVELDPRVINESKIPGAGIIFNAEDLNMKNIGNKSEPLIPHIIHQFWDFYDPVPERYINYIKTVIDNHPGWEYWFWTNADVDCYFQKKHKEFYSVFKSYKSVLSRADVMRYFVLYDYGGFYMDLDVEVLKPLDIWTYLSPSILSQENYEHSYIIHKKKENTIVNAVMATRPKHPFYLMLQNNLKIYKNKYYRKVLESTGSFFVNEIYKLYGNSLTVIHPKYWFPTFDPIQHDDIFKYCNNQKYNEYRNSSSVLWRAFDDICRGHIEKEFRNRPYVDSFLNHHWVHTHVQEAKFKSENTKSVYSVAPNLVRVSSKLKLQC